MKRENRRRGTRRENSRKERHGEGATIAHRHRIIDRSKKWPGEDHPATVGTPMAAIWLPRLYSDSVVHRLEDSQNLSRPAVRGIQFLPFAPSALPSSALSLFIPLSRSSFFPFLFLPLSRTFPLLCPSSPLCSLSLSLFSLFF